MYIALTDAKRISAYTMRKAEISLSEGGSFSLKDGLIIGTFAELKPEKRIVMNWRMQKYPPNVMTKVVIDIHANEGQSEVRLRHFGIPPDFLHDTEAEWRVEIFERMRIVLGYGAPRVF